MEDQIPPIQSRVSPRIRSLLDDAARTGSRTRSQQIAHYIRRGLEQDGYLRQIESAAK